MVGPGSREIKLVALALGFLLLALAVLSWGREAMSNPAQCTECADGLPEKMDGLASTVADLTTEVATLKAQNDEVIKETKSNIQSASDGLSNLGK